MSKILISINPEYVEKILDGSKRYEFRKTACKLPVDEMIIYCTSPVMKVIGTASVKRILSGIPEDIWTLTKEYAGISKRFFDQYYYGKNLAIAYEITAVKQFKKPRDLSYYGINAAPQSFVYVY